MPTRLDSTAAGRSDQTLQDLVRDGKSALERGDISATLDCFETVVQRWPEHAGGHNDLGSLYATLGRHADAESAFSRTLEIMPDTPNVLYNRGIVRLRLERWDGAIADFEAVLDACPDDADCWNNLGVTRYMSGDYVAAITHFLKALELTPYFPNALLNYVDAAVANGDGAGARRACREFLEYRDNEAVRRREIDLIQGAVETLLERACDSATILAQRHPDEARSSKLRRRLLAARQALAGGDPDA